MPFLDEPGTPLTVGQLSRPDEEEAPGFIESLPPAFQSLNTVGSAVDRLSEEDPTAGQSGNFSLFEPAPDYDPFQDLEDRYEPFATAFTFVNSPEEAEQVKRRLDRENEQAEQLAAAGWSGIAAGLVAGALDPVVLLPVGGTIAKTSKLSLLERGLLTAQAGLISTSAAEASLLATRDTRTTTEAGVAVAGGTLLSGILGAAGPAVVRGLQGGFKATAKRLEKDMEAPPEGMPDPLEPGFVKQTADDLAHDTSAGAQQVNRTTLAEESLKSALGLQHLAKFTSPIIRASTSPSIQTRRVAQQLAETPFAYEKNALGIPSPVAVETRIKAWDKPLADSIIELEKNFVAYRRRVADPSFARGQRIGIQARDFLGRRFGRPQPKMTFAQFKEAVGKTMRRGDESPIPEVQATAQAFRSKFFDPLRDRAIEAKLLPQEILDVDDVVDDASRGQRVTSYLTRVYDVPRIKAQRPEFRQILVDWLKNEAPEADELDIINAAEGIVDHILAVPDGRILTERLQIPRVKGALRERVLTIKDDLIEDYLISDIELVSRFYARSMVADTELTRAFGAPDPAVPNSGPDLSIQISEIVEDYQKLMAKAPDDKTRTKLSERMKKDIQDIEAMRDRLRGTYRLPADPDHPGVRIARTARDLNYMRLLGGMTISAIPDLGRVVMVNGLGKTFNAGIVPLVTNLKKVKLAAEEAKLAGTALDVVLDTRALTLADVGDEFGRHSRFDRGMRTLTNSFALISLMSPWNAIVKQWASMVTGSRIIDASAALAAGKASKGDIEKLAISGIDAFLAGKIAKQFNTHGSSTSGLRVPNTLAWDDAEAIEAFRSALLKDTDRVIVTKSVGDTPLWMSGELGKTMLQFRSFGFASTQRVLMAGLQQRDMAALNGAGIMFGLGMMVYYLKARIAGFDVSDDPAVWVSEGVDRSGLTGILYDINGVSEKVTGGVVGVSGLTGGPGLSRYHARNAVGAIAGPTFGLASDAITGINTLATGDVSASDLRAMRRLVPFQNLFYLRALLDTAQEGVAQELEVVE